MQPIKIIAASLLALAPLCADAQGDDGKKFSLHGSIQSDVLFPEKDGKIGATKDNWSLTNTYVELNLLNKYFTAGVRYEGLEHPLPGFDEGFKGRGIPYFYVAGHYKGFDLTLGDFYEQFGSGLILRTYEERALGIDNSLRGGKLTMRPFKGVNIKLLGGQQRFYWEHRNLDDCNAWIYGGDVELSLDRWFKKMDETGTRLTLGFSGVSKHEKVTDDITVFRADAATGQQGAYRLNLPENTAAFDARANLKKGNYSFLAEYAWKGQDPSSRNNYIYRHGQTLLLSGSYSKRGMSLLLQAKRTEDMDFMSRRSLDKGVTTACHINHLPAFSMQQTYALASIYPYATQNALGEWAFQGEFAYTFKRKTPLGGKYGTTVKLNASHIRAIDRNDLSSNPQDLAGTEGYTSKFFKVGSQIYYQDINVQLEKKLTKKFKLNLMYANQRYNKTVVEGEGGTVKCHVAVVEGKYQFNKKFTLRGEAQYLHTREDQKDWWYGLLELSILPNLMLTVSDQFNANVPDFSEGAEEGKTNRVHYLMGSLTFTKKAHRIQVGYGMTRAGYNCSGGVCRFVPAQKGLQASYSFNF